MKSKSFLLDPLIDIHTYYRNKYTYLTHQILV